MHNSQPPGQLHPAPGFFFASNYPFTCINEYMNIKINPEFERLIPPLSADEFNQLENNILEEGIRDPLVVWEKLIDIDQDGDADWKCYDSTPENYHDRQNCDIRMGDDVWQCERCGYGVAPLQYELILLDGHNRFKIAQKHKLEYQVHILNDIDSDEEAMEWMDRNQLGRRNLSPDMMSYIRGRMYNRSKKAQNDGGKGTTKTGGQSVPRLKTAEKIAEQVGVSDRTIKRDEQYYNAVEKVAEHLDTYGAQLVHQNIGNRKEVTLLARLADENPEAVKQVVDKAKNLSSSSNANGRKITDNGASVSIKTAFREFKKEQESEKAKTIELTPDIADLRLGDFMDELSDLPDHSVDIIITDPPYPYEYIEQWTRLGAFAKRVLKPGGFCVAYSGHMHLPEVMRRLSEHLEYYWTFCLLHSGFNQFLTPRNLYVGWKPILIFQNGFSLYKPDKEQLFDVIDGAGKAKGNHVWQQNENELNGIIDYFTAPGDTICDPFAGSGSTLIKAIEMKRKAIGCEIDEQHFNNAKKKISDAVS